MGFIDGADVNVSLKTERTKEAKLTFPAKSAKQAEPIQPTFSNSWSEMPLDSFLLMGI